jgi:hypothetical protein
MFSICSPRIITRLTPCLPGSGQLKPSFNESAQNCLSAPQKALRTAEAGSENSRATSWQRSRQHHLFPLRSTAVPNLALLRKSVPSGASSSPEPSIRTGPNCIICAAQVLPGEPNRRRCHRKSSRSSLKCEPRRRPGRPPRFNQPLLSSPALARARIARDHGASPAVNSCSRPTLTGWTFP